MGLDKLQRIFNFFVRVCGLWEKNVWAFTEIFVWLWGSSVGWIEQQSCKAAGIRTVEALKESQVNNECVYYSVYHLNSS